MVQIIAHRGACQAAPQNTIPAFLKAIEMGADGIENDVHLTKDGKIVICHNYDIDETSDGKGTIADYTLDELKKFDFGSYFSEKFKGAQIPTLEEYLDIAGPLKVMNVEIKPPQQKGSAIVRRTIETVRERGMLDKLLISSFDEEVIKEVKAIDPSVKTGFLYSIESPNIDVIHEDPFRYAEELGADALHPLCFFPDEEYVEKAHAHHLIVNPWTVNYEDGMLAMRDWGCDGIITDVPDLAVKTLRE